MKEQKHSVQIMVWIGNMKKFYLLFVSVFLLLCSCTIKEEEQQIPEDAMVEITAEIDESSKTYLHSDVDVFWEDGDEICVISEGGVKYRFSLFSGAGTKKATFRGSVGSSDLSRPYFALYPYDKSISKNTTSIFFPVLQTQYYKENSFGSKANPMYAKFKLVNQGGRIIPDSSTPIQFKNIFGALKISLKGECTVGTITLISKKNENLWGTVEYVRPTDEKPSDSVNVSSSESSVFNSSIVLTCGTNGKELDATNATDFYFSLPPGVLSDGMTIRVSSPDDDASHVWFYEKSTGNNISISKNEIRILPTAQTLPTVLSYPELANCYIAKSLNEAPQYANNKYAIRTASPDGAEVGPDAAAVIWETVNTYSAPTASGVIVNSVNYDKGYITFEATGNPGNALIAAKNGENIVWSWHIWVPEKNNISYDTYSNGTMLMDRNLGARTKIQSSGGLTNGLIYQFGRKDPFMGAANKGSDNNAISAICLSGYEFSNVNSQKTVEQSIQNPTAFVYGYDDWCSGGSGALWSENNTKMYDPCPPGYRVANSDAWNGLTGSNSYDSSNKYWAIDSRNTKFATYLLSGYKNSSGLDSVGSNGKIWTRNGVDGQNTASVWELTTTTTQVSTANRSLGCSVRCQKM